MKYKVGDKVKVNHAIMGEAEGVIVSVVCRGDTRWPYRVDTGESLFLYAEDDSPDLKFHDYIIGLAE